MSHPPSLPTKHHTPAYRQAYLSLGSNLQDPAQQLRLAIEAIQQFPACQQATASAFYQTSPVGPIKQEDFVNAVVSLQTALPATELLVQCLALETRMGRTRSDLIWGPRLIDIDVLWVEDYSSRTAELQLPHPEMHQRLFVLVPLAEFAPSLRLTNGNTVKQQIACLQTQGHQRVTVL